jgi:cyclic beta-1,2-glucan synthetase
MKAGILTAFFVRRDEARAAMTELGRRGFRRSALIHKAANGRIKIQDPFFRRRALAMGILSLSLGGMTLAAYLLGQWPMTEPAASILAAAALGAFVGFAWMQRTAFGIERRLFERYSRWLATEETVLVVQAPIERMRLPATLLRESGEIPPMVSVLNPERAKPDVGSVNIMKPLFPSQLQEQAKRLALEDRIDSNPRRNLKLLKGASRARRWIRLACSDLSNAILLEQRTSPISEWILDNEYIIEGNVGEVLQNLSRHLYRLLPILNGKPYKGMPRIYGLAKELVSLSGLRLDRENIVVFIEAYQAMHTLTIAELWAIPQMLRIALIEGIEDIAARGLDEIRDREMADFWANRLITANRRGHNQLFSLMAELAKNRRRPSPYFAFQLIDRIYDEETALAPVQSWLERIFGEPLAELNSREQNRQTKDQISIGDAVTSLRQLALMDWRQIFEDRPAYIPKWTSRRAIDIGARSRNSPAAPAKPKSEWPWAPSTWRLEPRPLPSPTCAGST